jgi:hypothetical protein
VRQILNDLHQMVFRDAVGVCDPLNRRQLFAMQFQVKKNAKRVIGVDGELHGDGLSSADDSEGKEIGAMPCASSEGEFPDLTHKDAFGMHLYLVSTPTGAFREKCIC